MFLGEKSRENPWKATFERVQLLVKLYTVGLQIYEKWTPSQICYKDFVKVILLSLFFKI